MSDWKSRAKKVETPAAKAPLPLDKSDELFPQPKPNEDARTMGRIAALGQGATGNFSDELMGVGAGLRAKADEGLQALGLEDPPEYVSDAIDTPGYVLNGRTLSHGQHIPETGRAPAQSFSGAYKDTRNEVRNTVADERRVEPYKAGALELAGAMALPTPKTGKIIKGTPFVKLALKYAKAGLPIGALMGFGGSDADTVGGAIEDTTIGAGAGAALGGLTGAALEKGTLKGAELLREWAKLNALKAAGARGGITNAMQKMGYETADDAKELGAQALDSKLIPFFGSKDSVWKRATEKLNQVGPGIRGVYESADKAGDVLADGQTVMAPSFDFEAAAKDAAKPLRGINTVAERNAAKAKQLVNDIAAQGKKSSRFVDALDLGTSMGGDVNHAVETKEAAKLHKGVYNAFKDARAQQLEAALGPDEVESLRSLNKVYSAAKDVRKLAGNASTREAVNREMGLVGSLQGQTLASVLPTGASSVGLIWPKVETFLTQRLPAAMAVSENKASQVMQKVMASKYAPVLTGAAAKGGAALAVAHYVLSQRDPEYRAMMEGETLGQ